MNPDTRVLRDGVTVTPYANKDYASIRILGVGSDNALIDLTVSSYRGQLDTLIDAILQARIMLEGHKTQGKTSV